MVGGLLESKSQGSCHAYCCCAVFNEQDEGLGITKVDSIVAAQTGAQDELADVHPAEARIACRFMRI